MHRNFTKIWLIVRLSFILLTAAFLHVQATGLSQSITLSGKNMDVRQVFAAIKAQTGYVVFYKKGLLDGARPVTVSVRDMPLDQFLAMSLKDQPFTYLVLDKTISLSQRSAPPPVIDRPAVVASPSSPPIAITGHILDADGRPLAGATIAVRNARRSTSSLADGAFTIEVNEGEVLVVSYVGYTAQEVRMTAARLQAAKSPMSIRLQPANSDLDQVQITAHGTTTKRLNPGDITTITAKDIEKNPVNNVLEAI